ncbi:metallophosphoesterase [Tellurirhabdus rosea]|uniref:metallophosphoesterase n=1 Tax=Tellurirhabdus rosea TaxID=2674997 RepID=UPI002259A000|nr:metallophosphoesterase [Tellurirhabdus rosea]
MNLLAIGDIHGRTAWTQINPDDYDRIIFLGDFVDSHSLSDSEILANFQRIIKLKRRYSDKVVLLIGNHDAQYLHYPNYPCSGFRPMMRLMLSELFQRHRALFQMAHQEGPYLFTHAGVSQSWLRWVTEMKAVQEAPFYDQLTDPGRLAEGLNLLHAAEEEFQEYLFAVSPLRGGEEPFGGPAWADRRETENDFLPGLHQVVGHTPVPSITTVGDESGSITYCDVLGTRADFYQKTLSNVPG